MTATDIQSAFSYLQSNDGKVTREIISHADWGGTDFHIADPDGNGIQIVTY